LAFGTGSKKKTTKKESEVNGWINKVSSLTEIEVQAYLQKKKSKRKKQNSKWKLAQADEKRSHTVLTDQKKGVVGKKVKGGAVFEMAVGSMWGTQGKGIDARRL